MEGAVDYNIMQNNNQPWFHNQNRQELLYKTLFAQNQTEHSYRSQNPATSMIGNNNAPCTQTGNNAQYLNRGHNSLLQTGQVQLSHQTSMQINIGGQELIQHKSTQNYALNAQITSEALNPTVYNNTNIGQCNLDPNYSSAGYNGITNPLRTQTFNNVPSNGQYPTTGRYDATQNCNFPFAPIANNLPKDPVYNMQNCGQLNPQNVNSVSMGFTSSYKNGMMKENNANQQRNIVQGSHIARTGAFYQGDVCMPVNNAFIQNGGPFLNGNTNCFPAQQNVNIMTSNIDQNQHLQNGIMKACNANVPYQQDIASKDTQIARVNVFYQDEVGLPINNIYSQIVEPMSNVKVNWFPSQANVNTMTSNITQTTQLQNGQPIGPQQTMINGTTRENPATYNIGRSNLNQELQHYVDPISITPDMNTQQWTQESINPYPIPNNNLRHHKLSQFGSEASVNEKLYPGNRKHSARKGKQGIVNTTKVLGNGRQAKIHPSSVTDDMQKEVIQTKAQEIVNTVSSIDASKQETMNSMPSTDKRTQERVEIMHSMNEEILEMNEMYRQTTTVLEVVNVLKRKSPVIDLSDIDNPKRLRTEKDSEFKISESTDQSQKYDFDESKISELSDQSLNSNLDSCIKDEYVYEDIETNYPDNNIQTNKEKSKIENDKTNCISSNCEVDVHGFTAELKKSECNKAVLPTAPDISEKSDHSDTENSKSDTTGVGNDNDLKQIIHGRKMNCDKNITYFMDVLSATYPRFLIFFHEKQVLCMTKQDRKYILIRELIFYFFKDRIESVQSSLKELCISKVMLTGKEKEDVSKYLNYRKVFTDKSVKNVGIIELEDANRIYHKLFPDTKCDYCVRLVSKQAFNLVKKNSSASVEDSVIVITDNDDKGYGGHLNVNSNDHDELLEDNALEKPSTEAIEDDQDSDTTILYIDDEDDTKTSEDHSKNTEYSKNTDKHSKNTDKHSKNTKYSKNTDEHSKNTDEHSKNTDKHSKNTDKHSKNTKYSKNTDEHSKNTDEHSKNTDKHSKNTDKHSKNTEYSKNTDEHSKNTNEHSKNTEYSKDTDEHSKNAEECSNNSQEHSKNAEECSKNTEEYLNNTEEPQENREEHSKNTKLYLEITEEYSKSTEEHSKITEGYSKNTEEYSKDSEEFSKNTEEYSKNIEEFSKNTEEYLENIEQLITTGVMELGGKFLRYIIKDSNRYVPITDLKELFSQNVINKTVDQICCSITKCNEIEARHFQQFDFGFSEIAPGEDMVDSKILENIYIVASLMEDDDV